MGSATDDGDRGRPVGRWWLLLVPPLLTAVVAVAAEYVASEGFTSAPELGHAVDVAFVAWAVSPALGLAGLVVGMLLARWRGRTTVLVGGLVLLALTSFVVGVSLGSESSTSALGLLFAPLYGWFVVVLTGLVVLVGSLVRGRRAST